MKIKKNKKTIIIIILVILLILAFLIICNNDKIRSKLKTAIFKEEPIKEITYEIYSNKNNIIRLLVSVTDTENGIEEIQLPDGGILTGSNRTQMGIDYKIEEDGEYTFKYKSSTGEEIKDTLVVNDEFRNNLIGIEKIQEVSTEQDYKITKKYDGTEEYKYYYAIGENNTDWLELSNKEIINIDMYKIIENNLQNEDKTTTLKVKKVNKYGNTVEVAKKIKDMQKVENLYNKEEKVIEGESIIACIRDNEIESGNYTLKVNGEEYPAEIYNYDENMNYITDKNLGTSEEDSRMLIMKYNGNLNIEKENLITAQTRKKGMFIYVAGELTNNGEISMTARGAKAEGQDVYLWKYDSGEYEYVPAIGATGGESVSIVAERGKSVTKEGVSGYKGLYHKCRRRRLRLCISYYNIMV